MSDTQNQDFFNSIDNQEIRSIVHLQGVYARGGLDPYEIKDKDSGKVLQSGESGFIQLLQVLREGSKKLKLTLIKVDKDNWHMIDILNKAVQLKQVQLQVEMREYGKNYSYVLTKEQPALKMTKAS